MPSQIMLSADAINDIDEAVEYYNGVSEGLGFEFTDTLDNFLSNISRLPTIILRVFNTNRQPFWQYKKPPALQLMALLTITLPLLCALLHYNL